MPESENESGKAAHEAEIDAVLAEFDGDARAALGALLHDLGVLTRDYESTVSRGYVRGRMPWDVAQKRQIRGNGEK